MYKRQTLEHLEDGQYVIAETTTSDKVSFIVNGGSECDYGIVEVAGNSNTVQIINTRKQPGGSILMEKFIRRNHALVKPSNDFQKMCIRDSPKALTAADVVCGHIDEDGLYHFCKEHNLI